ncbi:MAG: hypothetical protein WC360_07495 [Opitutales bacterium]
MSLLRTGLVMKAAMPLSCAILRSSGLSAPVMATITGRFSFSGSSSSPGWRVMIVRAASNPLMSGRRESMKTMSKCSRASASIDAPPVFTTVGVMPKLLSISTATRWLTGSSSTTSTLARKRSGACPQLLAKVLRASGEDL